MSAEGLEVIRMRADFAEIIARFYGELAQLRDLMGEPALTPEETIDRLLDNVLERNAHWARWCHGHGIPHLWLEGNKSPSLIFEAPCPEHPERRQITRRQKDRKR